MIVLLLHYKDFCDFNNFIKRFNTIRDRSIREKSISHDFSYNSFFNLICQKFSISTVTSQQTGVYIRSLHLFKRIMHLWVIKSWLKALCPFIWTENPSEGGRERENERERERERDKKKKKRKKKK